MSYWDASHPYSAGGAYVNFLGDEAAPDRLREAYGAGTYARLQQVKDAYDPGNILHRNQNILPTR